MAGQIETRHWINGQFVDSKSPQTFDLLHAATQALLVKVPIAGKEEIDAAVESAKTAQKQWFGLPATARAHVMKKMAALIRENSQKTSELDAMCMGRPVSGMDAEASAAQFEFCAGLGETLQGSSSLNTPGHVNFTLRQPFGVTAGITPWNFPTYMWSVKVAPAVAAGNAIIIKSSEKSPLSALVLAKLTSDAGFPPGLINVVSGAGETGRIIAEHMQIRKISFTGSTRTGRLIQKAAAESNLKNVTLELGGKSPTIIFDDADLQKAAASCVFSLQINAGQMCIASSRLYVHESVADKFLELYKTMFTAVKHGDPLDAKTGMGPQADAIQGSSVAAYLEIGKKDGKVATGGEKATVEGLDGHFIQPTIFTDVPDDSRINKEEVFGPVLVYHTFKTEEEAVARANDSEYGLYAAVFTKNIDRAMRVATALEAGTVAINSNSPDGALDMPFGGYKASGVGRENGKQALDPWAEVKTVLLKHD